MQSPQPSGGFQGLTAALLAEPKAVSDMRHTVRTHLLARGFPGDLVDVAQLCVSELVTNVVVHVGEATPISLHLALSRPEARVHLALTDPDPRALPTLLSATDDAESGRGLALIDALALHWGVIQHADGKTVWCELSAEAGPSHVW